MEMKQVLVESSKSYYQGFVLRESDLRRILDTIVEQFKKFGDGTTDFVYTVKYHNGTVAQTTDLDVLFAQENIGSAAIVRLAALGTYKLDASSSTVELTFRDVDSPQESGDIAVKLTIKSDSRDWVFVTSSILDERISKTKRLSVNQLSEKRSTRLLTSMFIPGMAFIAVMIATFNSTKDANEFGVKKINAINQLQALWSKGLVKDNGDLILKLAKVTAVNDVKRDERLHDFAFPGKTFGWLIGGCIALYIFALAFDKLYPAYNFCWGDYLESFNKKESARKFILVVVLLGLLLSIAGGLITNYIGRFQ
jgi:hypothetical protein